MNRITWIYTLITYLVTWSITLAAYFLHRAGQLTLDQLNLVYNLGALGPFAGAFLCAGYFYGRPGIKRLLGTFSFRGIRREAWLIALSPLLFFLAGLLLYPLFTGHAYTFSDTQRQFHLSTPVSYVSWLLPFITYSFFEEFGWRGFLLPHLQERYPALRATIILTILWAAWHLPFFLWRFQFSLFITVGFFFAIFIGAILLTSAFNLARGSIVVTILFHLANNVASSLDKEYIVAVVSTCFVFLAVTLVKRYGPAHLGSEERTKNFYAENK